VPVAAVADELELETAELERRIEAARTGLLAIRRRRVRPATDDKILAAWNALAISALAEAGRSLGEPRYVEAAVAAAEFVLDHLVVDGRLARSWREGRVGGPAYADDHALVAEACLTLYETTFELRWFSRARALGDELLERFHDAERGGFFQTAADAEALVIRPKELYDNATPSGNSAAADVLQRLAHLTGEPAYESAAVSALRLVRDAMAGAPLGFGWALCALDLYVHPVREVAIVGDPSLPGTRALAEEVTARRFVPGHVLALAHPDDAASREAVALLLERPQTDGLPTAFVCDRFACRLPVTEPRELAEQLAD
jgi:uncharacterized protein YyaL (SSP411 family)